ncbi:hypothetical protein P9112_000268 [Eukaryota sp. TZLM1-RC]
MISGQSLNPSAPPTSASSCASHVKTIQSKPDDSSLQPSRAPENILDGFAILDASPTYLHPSQLSSLFIRSKGFTAANTADFSFFSNLANIDARDNHLNLHHFLPFFPALTTLSLACNSINTPTLTLSKPFSQLKSLDLSFNFINSGGLICFTFIPNLEYLDLSFNNLVTLPCVISSLKKLIFLNVKGNLLGSNSFNVLKQMTNLCELDISRNKITKISEIIPELSILNIAENRLKTMDSVILLNSFSKLKEVDLSSNPFKEKIVLNVPITVQKRQGSQTKISKFDQCQPKILKEHSSHLWNSINKVAEEKHNRKQLIQSLIDGSRDQSIKSTEVNEPEETNQSFFLTATQELTTPIEQSSINQVFDQSKSKVNNVKSSTLDNLIKMTCDLIDQEAENEFEKDKLLSKPVGQLYRQLKAEINDPLIDFDPSSIDLTDCTRHTTSSKVRNDLNRVNKRKEVTSAIKNALESVSEASVFVSKKAHRKLNSSLSDTFKSISRSVSEVNNAEIGIAALKTELGGFFGQNSS